MIVTDLKYAIENRTIEKLDLMIRRCTHPKVRRDSLLIIEGSEGEGKTNASEAIGYYIKSKTNREIHMFFKLESLMNFAKSTENKIIIWDEPSIDSLSTDWFNDLNKNLMRLLMTCRKKRHFFIFNFVKFYKFSEYINVDRSLALIHMYSKNEVTPGRYIYIKKKKLENLFNDYKRKKERNYKKYMNHGGDMPLVEDKLGKMGLTIEGTPNCDLKMYEEQKDKAILSIGNTDKTNKYKLRWNDLRKKISKLRAPILTMEMLYNQLSIPRTTILSWREGNLNEKEDDA